MSSRTNKTHTGLLCQVKEADSMDKTTTRFGIPGVDILGVGAIGMRNTGVVTRPLLPRYKKNRSASKAHDKPFYGDDVTTYILSGQQLQSTEHISVSLH